MVTRGEAISYNRPIDGAMLTVAIPLLAQAPQDVPFGGLTVELPSGGNFGELPADLHACSLPRQQQVLGFKEPPPAVWRDIDESGIESVRRAFLPTISLLHLLGNGVMKVREAWVYKNGAAEGYEFTGPQDLRMPLNGGVEDFFLPSGITSAIAIECAEKMHAALTRAGWLSITLEHMLLALDRTGLSDGYLDLCICLESLLQANTEVGFRLSSQIPRLVSDAPSELREYQKLLTKLYDVRSKHVHGGEQDPSNLAAVRESQSDLEGLMKGAVRYAIDFFSSGGATVDDWKVKLKDLIFGTASWERPDWGLAP